MKVYVRRYEPKEEKPTARRPFERVGNDQVEYSTEPDRKVSRFRADDECGILRRLGVHVGQQYCEFAVEELPDGEFGIICPSHPDIRRVP